MVMEMGFSGETVGIKYLNIHCPKCDTPLLTDMTEDYSVYCPRCNFRTIEIVPIYVEENIKRSKFRNTQVV